MLIQILCWRQYRNYLLREQGRPNAVVDLIKRLVTVSMRTQELLVTLPALEILEQ